MLPKCIQNLQQMPSFGIAHYKNHESVQNTRQLKASTLTLVYLSSVIGYGGSFANNISWILIEILWQIHDLPKCNISK